MGNFGTGRLVPPGFEAASLFFFFYTVHSALLIVGRVGPRKFPGEKWNVSLRSYCVPWILVVSARDEQAASVPRCTWTGQNQS